jgi:hypothetical protein
MDSKELAELVDFRTTPSLDSLLVVRHGKIVAEAYYAPYTQGIPRALHSATKAVISTLTAIAWKEHLLDSPNHRDLDIVAVTTGRDTFRLSEFADLVSGSVKSDEPLPADATSAKLLANKILDISTEKPTQVGPTSKMAAIISGKVYRFPPNEINVKSLSLILTDPQPHYDIETYARDTTKFGPRFTGPIGLDGLYRKGELTCHGFVNHFEGLGMVDAIKGTWQGDHAFVIDWLALGLGRSPERSTLTNVLRRKAQRASRLSRGRPNSYRRRDGWMSRAEKSLNPKTKRI